MGINDADADDATNATAITTDDGCGSRAGEDGLHDDDAGGGGMGGGAGAASSMGAHDDAQWQEFQEFRRWQRARKWMREDEGASAGGNS